MRRQLPAYSPLSFSALPRGLAAAARRNGSTLSVLESELSRILGADIVQLTDSGTSALVAAFRGVAGARGVVALPAYACIDLAAAAVAANVRVRLYDLDPVTLGADEESVKRVIGRGVDALVAVHLYGYPVDMPWISSVCEKHGVALIEDAAQGLGGMLAGRSLGSFGPISVLSFGRGKGVGGVGGGALALWRSSARFDAVSAEMATLARAGRGMRNLAQGAALIAFARPRMFWIPASIPQLRLGEMVYRRPGAARVMPPAAAAMVTHSLLRMERELAARRRNAARLDSLLDEYPTCRPIRPADGDPGFLRYAVLDESGRRSPSPRHGIARGYPLTVAQQPPIQRHLIDGEGDHPGAQELRDRLFTLPVHSRVTEADFRFFERWLRASS